MLTNLDFLEPGAKWPPPSEKSRLSMYDANKELFDNGHEDVYKEDFKRIQRVIGNFNDVVSYPVIINFQKLISLKIADLLVGEEPIIDVDDSKFFDDLKERSNLSNGLYELAIDISRFGDGLFYVREENGPIIDLTQPPIWFPVVDPYNVRRYSYHVLAWEYSEIEGTKEVKKLRAEIHSKGSYETRVMTITSNMSGPVIYSVDSSDVAKTRLDDFAVIPVHNVITSDRATGYDDYSDIDSIVSELLVRVAQIARILDKHAAPSVQGPATALEQDPATGEWRLKMGNYFPRDNKDDPGVEYITWEGHLESAFMHVDRLINFLYTMSEMGSAVFGDLSQSGGQIASGSALKRLMISPLAKVNRIRMRMDPALKKAIKLCAQLAGVKVESVSITWQDGLPGDPLEEAQIMNFRVGKPTMSQLRALKTFDALSDDDADEEIERIQEDGAMANPMQMLVSDGQDRGTEEDLPEGTDNTNRAD